MDEQKILNAIMQMENRVLAEIKAVREDIKALDEKVDRRFRETQEVVREVSDTVTEKITHEIREIKGVIATNSYDIAVLRRQA